MGTSVVALMVVLFAMAVIGEALFVILLFWLVLPALHGHRVAGRLNGNYAGNLYADRRAVIVLTGGPAERGILVVRPEGTESISYEELWEMHEAGDVRWFDYGFEAFQASIRRNESAHPTVAARLAEYRHGVNRRLWPVAVVAFLVLAVVLYVEIEVLHISFARI